MNGKRVFDIFVYRLSPVEHSGEVRRLRRDNVDPAIVYQDIGNSFWKSLSAAQQINAIEKWGRSFDQSSEARCWLYNDVIGYIALFADHDQVKAEYWFIEGRIQRMMKNRVFRYHDKVLEIWFSQNDSSHAIYKKIENGLVSLTTIKPFKNRYIDLEIFHNIGLNIDWKSLTS